MNRLVSIALLLLATVGCSTAKEKDPAAKKTEEIVKDKAPEVPKVADDTSAKPASDLGTKPASEASVGDNKTAGTWKRVGEEGAWKLTRGAVAVGNQMFSLERGESVFWRTDLATGKYKTIGNPDFAATNFLLASADAIYTIEKDGNLFRVSTDDARWKRIGKEGDWKSTRLATILGNHMFTIEKGDGRIFKTDLSNGSFVEIGKSDFADSKWLLATTDALLSIENDGRLFRIDPNDGTWKLLSEDSAWKATKLAVTHGDWLYTIERGDGRVFKTDVTTGAFTTIGGADFADSRFIVSGDDAIYTIESDGNLFRIEP